MPEANAVVLSVRGLTKSYGAVEALSDVTFDLQAGSVLGLIGDNGAGKSTLVKCISGLLAPDRGEILIDGSEMPYGDPEAIRTAGVETVYQDLMLVPPLDVGTNLFLGREQLSTNPFLRRLGWLDKSPMYREAATVLERLKINISSVKDPVENLSGGQRQSVAVGRAAAWGRHIVLMDEPVAALGVTQSQVVLELVRTLANEGVAVVIISHNMEQVLNVCDEVLVMRHGENVGKFPVKGVDAGYLVSLMTAATRHHDATT